MKTTFFYLIIFSIVTIMLQVMIGLNGIPLTNTLSTIDINKNTSEVSIFEEMRDFLKFCPVMLHYIFYNVQPRDELNAGIYVKYPVNENTINRTISTISLKTCIENCCSKNQNDTCNVAFYANSNCYHIHCYSNVACLPKKHSSILSGQVSQMVLVNPISHSDVSWLKTLKTLDSYDTLLQKDTILPLTPATFNANQIEDINFLKLTHKKPIFSLEKFSDYDYDTPKPLNEDILSVSSEINSKKKTSLEKPINKGLALPTKLMVSVVSKEVRLPEKEVTLSAYTVPDEQSTNTKYKYLWSLINQPKSPLNGTISDQSQSKVKLSNLSEGLYTFKVTVKSDEGLFGETMANVTVVPEKRLNQIPHVIITPKEQTIQQPTTNAVLDGSTSTDDNKITNWHWEVVSGPIGYQPSLPEVNTLQLSDLVLPGVYTFKLTVTDSNNATNSTSANITVLKVTDYPPVANAGDGVILYLPNNKVTLNGTASSDDHEIVAWEWTKNASDDKAVDMQDTRTPYVKLSNLEQGMYTFVLKVTDASNQSSTAKVHVFVKLPTNAPPKAVAQSNMTINLPLNWVLLNGSLSSDDINIQYYHWKQQKGPNKAVLCRSNEAIANATGLTLGVYKFILTVTDKNNNSDSTSIWIKVVQEKNIPPTANAGGDQILTLPLTAIFLNGSASSDDLSIVKFRWTREDDSLVAGQIVEKTDTAPIMILINVVPGRYVFKLTVSDEQGLKGTDTVSIFIHPDPLILNLVQLTLPLNISMLTQAAVESVIQKIAVIMGEVKIYLRSVFEDNRTGVANVVFYVADKKGNSDETIWNGLRVERFLKKTFKRDGSILGTMFVDLRTVICQNRCSNHGVCNTDTRVCDCEPFWMQSFGAVWGFNEANCDWSVLYVFIAFMISFIILSALFWITALTCRTTNINKRQPRQKASKYSLVGANDNESTNYSRATFLTDSAGTDSDVLFETSYSKNSYTLQQNRTNIKESINGTSHSQKQIHKILKT